MKNIRSSGIALACLCLVLCICAATSAPAAAAGVDIDSVLGKLSAVLGVSEEDVKNYESVYASSLPIEYEQKKDSVYLALGGATAGGLAVVDYTECYADLVAGKKGFVIDETYFNRGETALYAADAVGYVKRYASDVEAADLITFQLDGASFVSSCVNGAVNGDAVNWSKYLSDGELISLIGSFRQQIIDEYGDKYGKANAEKIAVMLEYILYECVTYGFETLNAVEEIRNHNASATVLVLGLYNPLRGLKFTANGEELDAGDMVEQMISFCNTFLLVHTLDMKNTAFVDVSDADTEGFGEVSLPVNDENALTTELYSIVSATNGQYASVKGHEYMRDRVTSALRAPCKHAKTTVKNVLAATCTAEGYTGDTVCADCGKEMSRGKTTAKSAHSFSAWSETAPTCTADGAKSRACTSCGKVESVVLSPVGHAWDRGVVKTEPTCEADGLKVFTCAKCNETETETLEAKGHAWDKGAVTVEPTCEAEGERAVTCTACGKAEKQTLEAKGHSWDKGQITLEPTCEAEGERAVTCTACGKAEKQTLEAKGHSWDKGAVTVEPTCEGEGERAVTCTACGKAEKQVIEAKGHSWDKGAVTVEPTCEGEGERAVTCTVCGKAEKQVIEAKGHSWDKGQITREPSCESEGERAVTCTSCGKTETQPIEAKGHSWDEGKIIKEPGCDTEGEKEATCKVCGTFGIDKVAPKGHYYKNYTSNGDATCEKDGTKTASCEVCGLKNTVADKESRVSHEYEDGKCKFCGKDAPKDDFGKWIIAGIVLTAVAAIFAVAIIVKKKLSTVE